MSDLTNSRFLRGSGLLVLGNVFSAFLQFLSVIILSRLLDPSDFGLIAMAAVFVALGNLLRDFGMPLVALQAKELSIQQSSNIFWLNAGLATTVGAALAISAPLISSIYSEPRLIEIIPVMALNLTLLGIGAQFQVQLSRSMRYGTLASISVVSNMTGIGAAWWIATIGGGYWALVTQYVTASIVLLLLQWYATKWLPSRFRRGHGAIAMARSGSQYGLAQGLTFLQNNVATLLIGAQLGAAPLGVYNRADKLIAGPIYSVLSPLTNVVVPTLNKIKKEGGNYYHFLSRIQFMVAFGLIWVISLAAGSAEKLIPLALGPGWNQVIPVFQLLSVSVAFSVLSTVSYWGFIINQLSKQLFYYNLVTKPMVVVCVLVGTQFGLSGVAAGMAFGLFISWPINLIWLSKTAKFPGWEFFWNGMSVVGAGAFSAASALVVSSCLSSNLVIVDLLIGVIVGSLVYLFSLSLVGRTRSSLVEALIFARNSLFRRRK